MFNTQGWAALKPHFHQHWYQERFAETFVTAKGWTRAHAHVRHTLQALQKKPGKEITFKFNALSFLVSQYAKYKLKRYLLKKKKLAMLTIGKYTNGF